MGRSNQAELRQAEEVIKVDYIVRKVAEKKKQVMDGNKKVQWIMKSWMGFTTDEVFGGWRYCVEVSKKQHRKEQRQKSREKRLRYEDELATYEFKKMEASHFAEECLYSGN